MPRSRSPKSASPSPRRSSPILKQKLGKSPTMIRMLSKLSDDSLKTVFAELGAADRARFSAVNTRHHKLLHQWKDIWYMVAYRSGIAVSSKKHIFELANLHPTTSSTSTPTKKSEKVPPIVRLMIRAPCLRKVVISDTHHLKSVKSSSFALLSHVDDLTLPADMFSRASGLQEQIKAAFSLKRLQVLRVLQLHDKILRASSVLHFQHAKCIRSKRLYLLKLQGVSVTASALDTITMKHSQTLHELCLIGALVHTPDAPSYYRSIGRLKSLSRLSLPPSLFSLSREPSSRDFRIITAMNLRHLSVYVFESEIIETRFFLTRLMPKTLVELCVHDASCLMQQYLQNPEFKDLRFRVIFCEKGETLFDRDFMHGHCNLISHLVWRAPYKAFPTEFHTQVPEWHCFLSEIAETQRENTEQTAQDSPPSPAEAADEPPPVPENLQHQLDEEAMIATMARLLEQMMNTRLEGAQDRQNGPVPMNMNVPVIREDQAEAIVPPPIIIEAPTQIATTEGEASARGTSVSPDTVATPAETRVTPPASTGSSSPDISTRASSVRRATSRSHTPDHSSSRSGTPTPDEGSSEEEDSD